MSDFEVPQPIICSPFEEPGRHWHLEEGVAPEAPRVGRRPAGYFYRDPGQQNEEDAPTGTLIELKLVNLIRERVKAWREDGYPGATSTTTELLHYWRRDGRKFRFFFAQLEAIESIVFLTEARRDFLQGVTIPADEPSDKQKADLGYRAWRRHACKMATGSGKTMVMGLITSWSILNKVNDRSNAAYSDAVLIVCPNVTIRSRLAELDPKLGDASLYRKADLVPAGRMMADLMQGDVVVTNWHNFEPHSSDAGGVSGRVVKAGRREIVREVIKVVFEWLAENTPPTGIPSISMPELLNEGDLVHTIRVDSKVVTETDTGHAKSDEAQWMRFTLDTVGKRDWPTDAQGRPIYPEEFEALAAKRQAALHPPGRDIRCIVSVGMLTEGWDCNTVTHIVGLRPFMSQLLCEQVVGRGLRRRTYELGADGLMKEEVAQVFGVPFQVIPFKANPQGAKEPSPKRHHVCAVPGRAHLAITFPRVERYRQAIRNRVNVDWASIPPLWLDPTKIPPEVEVRASLQTNTGRPTLLGPGKLERLDLNPFRSGRRMQELVFEMAGDLTREYLNSATCEAPAHVLFPQICRIVQRYVDEKVTPIRPAERIDLFLSPYYGWAIERLTESIRPDTEQGEAPEIPQYERNRGAGSTAEVDYWTSRDVREVIKSHLNYVVADTAKWEQQAAYAIDTHPKVEAFVKNAGLGFGIPYLYNGQPHDYVPDFIIRLAGEPNRHLILETKGYDELAEVKSAAAQRWVNAVNADGQFGSWQYALVRSSNAVGTAIDAAASLVPADGIRPKAEIKGEACDDVANIP